MAQPPPLCFIGSSSEGIDYARAVKHHLERAGVEVEEWDIGTFGLGQTTIEALEEALARCSFAVFVASGDDRTVVRRRRARISPRDNIIFEFGLFAGRLGRERVFLVAPDDVPNLKLPSDLLGVTIGFYRPADTVARRRSGMSGVAEEILEAIGREGPVEAPSDPALANELLVSVSRQLTQLSLRMSARPNLNRPEEWVQSLLTAALDPFLVRTDDAYAVWLVPAGDGRLDVEASASLPTSYEHHRWARAEGLVGRVWDTGVSAATSALRQHPWFVRKPGCENESYVCAAVGGPGSRSGVLAVGSDVGFNIHQGDEGLVRAYAAVLSLIDVGSQDGLVGQVETFVRRGLKRLR